MKCPRISFITEFFLYLQPLSMPDKSTLEVCLSPGLLPLYPIDDKVVVVIDVLRATTTMCVAIDQGARR